MLTSEETRFCSKCGVSLQGGSSYCPKCGTAVSPSSPQPLDWREQRRRERAQRRGGHEGYGGLIVASILIVVGLAVFFPSLPWEVFWGGLLILLGVWVAFAWTMRGRPRAQTAAAQP